MHAKLNSRIRYNDGYVQTLMLGEGREPQRRSVKDADFVSPAVGWGDSNAIVRWDDQYFLAAIIKGVQNAE